MQRFQRSAVIMPYPTKSLVNSLHCGVSYIKPLCGIKKQEIVLILRDMKKFCLNLLALAIALSATAESKLDLHSRAVLRQYQLTNVPTVYDARTKSLQSRKAAATHVNGLIELEEGATFEQLEAAGIKVNRTRGRIALVTMPISEVERFSTLKSVKKLQLSRPMFTKMNKARKAVGIDKIHAGEGLPQAYTGKGVITGIVDQGIDPHHINFKDENGKHRFSQLMYMFYDDNASNETDLSGYVWEAGDDLSDFETDSYDTYHAAHTIGIMAGSYKGNVTAVTGTNVFDVKIEDIANPYYGIAYDSEIAAACGSLSDYSIAIGVDYALQYAYDHNKPAVVNLSLGSNIGARDGTQVMCKFLEECGKEAIVCVAAGNEGELPIALNQTFTAEDTEMKTFIYPIYPQFESYTNFRYGQLYIYSDSEEEFEVDIVVYNKSRGTTTFKHTCVGNTNGTATYYATPGFAAEGDLTNQNFSNAFQGYFGIGSMIDSDNGRYYAMLDFQIFDNMAKNANGNYILGFVVRGKEGQRVDAFSDALFTYFDNYGQEGWDEGSCNGSINDMACGENILVVGAYTSCNSIANLDKSIANTGYTESQVAPFSSYATLIDGRNLPHVCAPGGMVVSSTNTPYIDMYNIGEDYLQAKYTNPDGTVNYWQEASGTSMATPVVAGSIALWLEADPTLTIDEVKEIVEQSAVKDNYVTGYAGDPVQWGAGKFDAYAGLKEVIRRATNSGIGSVLTQDDRLMVSVAGHNVYNVFLGGAETVNAVLYNMQGQAVLNHSVEGDEVRVDASGLTSGVYVLNVNGTHSQKIIVK